MLASGSKKPSETSAGTIRVVAFSTARAVTAGFISISIKRVGSRRALLEIAGRATVTLVADAPNVFHRIPGSAVCTVSTGSKVLLRPASSTIVTVVRAYGTLARNTLVTSKALALTSVAIADTFVGALSPGVKIVGIDHITNPSKILRAGSLGAIRASPLSFTINSGVAFAVVVELTGSVTRALVLAHTCATVTSLVPSILTTSSPCLIRKRRLTGRHSRRLSSGLSRHAGGLTRRLTGRLESGGTKCANKGGK